MRLESEGRGVFTHREYVMRMFIIGLLSLVLMPLTARAQPTTPYYEAVVTSQSGLADRLLITFLASEATCNQDQSTNIGIINPRYLVWLDTEHAGKACTYDAQTQLNSLGLNTYYSVSLRFVIPSPESLNYGPYKSTLSEAATFYRKDCPPDTPCLICTKTPGYVQSLTPNTPPGTFVIGILSGTITQEVKIPSNSTEITMPGFSRPVRVGDVWSTEYCIP